MKKCKVTVVKTSFFEDLACQYGEVGVGPCPIHTVGDTFFAHFNKPDGLCHEAWKAIHPFVFALLHTDGNEYIYDKGWMNKPGIAICSCTDGLRPVVFKLELVEDDSH